ncbi:hypothetical protein CAPTEDRAFT_200914 [Capitella teleta]|uniref:Neurotransmitter-gated ion-channel ligand-binding domain-containing protein n=1 Tax=Capitella teleta TaxID=283909 RepID=R7U321_CAPTE|nr:hypothetical protein CAPTEDRAFT_200914 [Capitella teleta]|eukprot:ELT98071.1 hypothetical protein CAPTEDRAFT_200914 [Capitella teleta]
MITKGWHLMVLLLGGACGRNNNTSSTHERRLIADLLSQRTEALGSNIRCTRPMKTEGPVNLKVTIRFQKLVELDAASDILTAKLWIYLEWTDHFMTWNPEDYGNITSAVWLAMDDVWMPDFAIYDSLNSRIVENSYSGLFVRHDGTVVFIPIVVASLPCDGDISTFPYDIHRCTISIGSWIYSPNEVSLISGADEGLFLQHYQQNQQWSLQLDSHNMESILDDCCSDQGDYQTAKYHVTIRRNASFFFFALIFPGCLLNLIVTVMFILPPEFQDKINIGVSIFLSHIVLIMVLVEVIPSNGQSLPVIGQFYCANTCMAVLSILASVVTYNMQAHTSQVCESSKRFLAKMAHVLGLRQLYRDAKPECDAPLSAGDFWHVMARVVDRILLLIYTVAMVTCSLTIFFQLRC